jgi:GT2 family glycosyltransferase
MSFAGVDLRVNWLMRASERPHPVPLTPGGCQAVRRTDFFEVGGFDEGMTRWGAEDLELCLRFALNGYEVMVEPRCEVFHLFRDRHPYPVEMAHILHNHLRMALLHFNLDRFERIVDHYRSCPWFPRAMRLLLAGDVMRRRSHYEETRRRDDDWFCARFGCRI